MPLIKKIISTCIAPKPVGPYNQAVLAGDTLYVSGTLGIDLETSKLVEGGAVPQARLALKHIGSILEAAGARYESVVKTTILMADLTDFAAVNDVYKEFFTDNFPARATYQVAKLPLNAAVEIEAIALVGDVKVVGSAGAPQSQI